MDKRFLAEIQEIKKTLSPFKAFIKRPAKGALKHDYLVPGGYYQEQWDWDAYFMGVALSSEISSEAIYLRNWALNYIEHADKDGFSAGCVTPKGAERGHRLFLMKPILVQGIYLAAKFLNDFSWIKPVYEKIRKMVTYREKHVWSKKYDLAVWTNTMESGADNNIAAFGFPNKTVVASDVNAFIYREYKAMSKIASVLNKGNDIEWFTTRTETIKKNVNKYLWDQKEGIYFNIDAKTGQHIKRIAYSCFLPLWTKMASKKQANIIINQFLLSPEHMWSKYGIRTLSRQDNDYNNLNHIKPYSNWRGPIWPIANYLYMHSLLNYGYQKEAISLARTIFSLIRKDIKKTGGMHENYDAETGKPLAAPNFVSWNILVGNMLEEALASRNPFEVL